MCVYICIYIKWGLFLVLKLALYQKNWSFKRTEMIVWKIFSCWIFHLFLELRSSAFPYINSACHHPPSLKEWPYTNKNKTNLSRGSCTVFSVDHSYDLPEAQSSGYVLSSNPAPFIKAKPWELPDTGIRSCGIFHLPESKCWTNIHLKRPLEDSCTTFDLKWVDYWR